MSLNEIALQKIVTSIQADAQKVKNDIFKEKAKMRTYSSEYLKPKPSTRSISRAILAREAKDKLEIKKALQEQKKVLDLVRSVEKLKEVESKLIDKLNNTYSERDCEFNSYMKLLYPFSLDQQVFQTDLERPSTIYRSR
jgi:hypothetical protein